MSEAKGTFPMGFVHGDIWGMDGVCSPNSYLNSLFHVVW